MIASTRRLHLLRWFPALGAAALVLAVATACGGSDDGGSGGDTPSNGGDGGQNPMAAYTQCLQQNGVTLPSAGAGQGPPSGFPSGRPSGFPSSLPSGLPSGLPGGGPGGPGGMGRPEGVDETTWQKAQEACASLRPTGGPGGGPGRGNRGANAAYQNCLKENGVTATGAEVTADPKFAEADQACAALRPTGAPN